MARISLVLLVALFVSLANAFSAPTFCKCTCFTNSTIIPLGPQKHTDGARAVFGHAALAERAASSSCSQCNRAFCLDYNLPICKNAEEKDVVTMCFQRDSRKDQIIVWTFLLGTGGLLGWTAVQKVMAVRAARAATHEPLPSPGAADTGPRGQYAPLGGSGD